uniref:Uncharacterized protein n=1 Tax=Oryza nivara TaxID=4536 RepID=A0A0E0IRG8_ORYNI
MAAEDEGEPSAAPLFLGGEPSRQRRRRADSRQQRRGSRASPRLRMSVVRGLHRRWSASSPNACLPRQGSHGRRGGRAECRRESDLRLAALRHNHGLQSADAASLPPWPSTDDADDSADLAEPSPAATDSITVGVELATLFLGESRGCS